MKDFAAAFSATLYEDIAQQWIADTDRYLATHPEQIHSQLMEAVEETLDKAVRSIPLAAPPTAYMTFSVLYASVYCGRPQVRLDLYGDDWVIGPSHYTAYLDLPWLFALWQEHKEQLAAAAQSYSNRISGRHIRQMLWRSVRMLTYLAAERMKYWSAEIAAGPAFERLSKAPAFHITWGEYQDWQNTVYAILPAIDIFQHIGQESLQSRDFAHCVYRDKTFRDLDLSGSRFHDCTFDQAIFDNVDLHDCRFDNCLFRQVQFHATRMLGITAHTCRFQEVSFNQVTGGISRDNDEPLTGLYKNAEFRHCQLHNLHIRDSCLADASLIDCDADQITLSGGDCENSGFAQYLTPEPRQAGEAR